MTTPSGPMATRNVLVMVPADRVDLNRNIPINDVKARKAAVRLRKDFNAHVLDSVKTYTAQTRMDHEADFSMSGVNVTGFFFSCTDAFAAALKTAALPHIGPILTDRPLPLRP